MIYKKTFKIHSFKNWDDEINASAVIFNNTFSIYPNIILFNSYMTSRIDILANENKDYLEDEKGHKPDKSTFAQVDSFVSVDYKLEFCLDEKLPDNYYSLIYDSNPNGDDGEPVPDEDSDINHLMDHVINN